MTTENNNSLFVYDFTHVSDNEDLSYLGGLTAEQASSMVIDGLDSDLFNQVVTCNPKYEIFSIHRTRIN